MSLGLVLVKDCQFGVSPVNYSDSDSNLPALQKKLASDIIITRGDQQMCGK